MQLGMLPQHGFLGADVDGKAPNVLFVDLIISSSGGTDVG